MRYTRGDPGTHVDVEVRARVGVTTSPRSYYSFMTRAVAGRVKVVRVVPRGTERSDGLLGPGPAGG